MSQCLICLKIIMYKAEVLVVWWLLLAGLVAASETIRHCVSSLSHGSKSGLETDLGHCLFSKPHHFGFIPKNVRLSLRRLIHGILDTAVAYAWASRCAGCVMPGNAPRATGRPQNGLGSSQHYSCRRWQLCASSCCAPLWPSSDAQSHSRPPPLQQNLLLLLLLSLKKPPLTRTLVVVAGHHWEY
jgi:hypothetical protein